MKKKDGKDKDKQKIDYHDLINKNVHDFKLTFDYSGYQYTRLDLNVNIILSLVEIIGCLVTTLQGVQVFGTYRYLQ